MSQNKQNTCIKRFTANTTLVGLNLGLKVSLIPCKYIQNNKIDWYQFNIKPLSVPPDTYYDESKLWLVNWRLLQVLTGVPNGSFLFRKCLILLHLVWNELLAYSNLVIITIYGMILFAIYQPGTKIIYCQQLCTELPAK